MFANGFPCGYQMSGHLTQNQSHHQFEGRYERMLRERYYKQLEVQMAVKLLSRVFSLIPLPELAGNQQKVGARAPDPAGP